MHQFDIARQQFVNAVTHDGVGLAATNLHQHPGPGGALAYLSRQHPCNAMVNVFVEILHTRKPSAKVVGMTLTSGEPPIFGGDNSARQNYASAGGNSASSIPISSTSL